jgi:hypothetical protein
MLPLFYGLSTEDPYKHLDEFIEICSTIRLRNFSEDALRMRLFPFSLKDKAKYLLNSLETNSIISWDLNAKMDALSRKLDQLLASGFVPATTSHIHTHTPHDACSFCSDPSHQARNCPIVGQFSEPSVAQMNATFSRLGGDHFNNSYNLGLRNNINMWRPIVPQYNGLQNQAYHQSNNQFYQPPPNSRPPNPQ